MAEYYILAIDSIQSVQEIVNGQSKTPLQLNDKQCEILARELAEVSVYLREVFLKFNDGVCVRQIAILHLYSAIKRAEYLVEKCCCKYSESWLVAAMTLVEIQEDFAAIILDLHYWRLVLNIEVASSTRASHQKRVELLMLMDEAYEEQYKKFRSSDLALQQAAVKDRKKIVLRLAEVQGSGNSLSEFRALHLRSWLAQLGEEAPVADLSVLQKVVVHENGRDPVLGMGGCGAVLRVKWLGVQCALKMLNVKDEREATALKGLLHPNIIRLYFYWEAPSENPKSNLLMELMDMDLSVYIESQLKRMASSNSAQEYDEGENTMPFSLPVAIDIMLQVGRALRYLHERRLTHRDLNTSNILVRQLGEGLTNVYGEGYVEVKLADFALARAFGNNTTRQNHTVTTGTAVYGAPEIFGKDLATKRISPPMVDVWSFGAICAEILSGKKPYANEPRETLRIRIANGKLRPALTKQCPEYLAFIIRSCLEFRPERRPDFASICRMLRHAKLLSLRIMDLDDSRSFMAYTTRRGLVKSLSDQRASKVGKSWG